MNVAIIGHFGGNKKFSDGQTIKTVNLYDALIRNNINVEKIDTYYIKKNPFKFIVDFNKVIKRNNKIVVLLSSNGRKILFPILAYLSKHKDKEIYHYAIGGRLAREVKENPKWKDYVSSFK